MVKMELSILVPRNSQTLDDRFGELDELEIEYFPYDYSIQRIDPDVISHIFSYLRSEQRLDQDPLSPVFKTEECEFRDVGRERVIAKAHPSPNGIDDLYQRAVQIAENLEIPISQGFHGDLCLIYGIPPEKMQQKDKPGIRVYDSSAYLLILPHPKEMNSVSGNGDL